MGSLYCRISKLNMALSNEQLEALANLIAKHLGIVYSENNYFQLQKRVDEIARVLALPSDEAVFEKAISGLDMNLKNLLLDLATNNETSFFRDPRLFQAVEKSLIPDMLKRLQPKDGIRIWSAACSSGQEPYTLAMLFNEMRKKEPHVPKVNILATDISDKVLERAKLGKYNQLEIQRGLPAPLMLEYFSQNDDKEWQVKPELRSALQFRKLNLIEPFPELGKFELIFCRNVLIYQTTVSKTQVIKRFEDKLVDGGYLVLGAQESLVGISESFEQIFYEGAIYYRKKQAS